MSIGNWNAGIELFGSSRRNFEVWRATKLLRRLLAPAVARRRRKPRRHANPTSKQRLGTGKHGSDIGGQSKSGQPGEREQAAHLEREIEACRASQLDGARAHGFEI